MDCLTNYIGLKVCGTETSESGLFINSLPGISLESIDKIADSEQVTYAGVWADVQAEAQARFYVDVIEQITKCFQIEPYCDYEEIICTNKQILSNAWRYLLGNQLMLFRLYTTRLNRFTTIDMKQAAELRDLYQVEYDKSLSQAVKLIDVSSCCLDCGGNPSTVVWFPGITNFHRPL
jgi:hypothetical protein